MKNRFVLMMMTLLLNVTAVWARPGYSKPVDVVQPDGTTVTLLMHGDEFHSFMTTTDGYTVVKGADGFYRYAVKQGDDLTASAFVARNAEARSAQEQAFLAGSEKMISAKMSEAGRQWKERVSKMYSATYQNLEDGQRRAITPGAISERIDYSKFKGLVVLVNWNDKSFGIQEPVAFYQKLINQENYTMKTGPESPYPYDVKGSVRDYFRDNSMGMFNPTFDVVGPLNIDYSCEYPWPKDGNNVKAGFDSRISNILKAVLAEVNKTVDFSNYDLNNDGVIDMVYIIFAGYGSYVAGNNPKYMWPHAEDFSGYYTSTQRYRDYFGFPSYNGKKFGRYACSVEIQDYEGWASQHAYPDGIGTMCHEFSHVLGLADHYDTQNQESGAQTPGYYDVMDGGGDGNQGLSPVGYSAFERYILGFADKTVKPLELAGDYTLEPLNTSNTGYIVKTKKDGEVFYVENRQKQGWDECLPKAGLLVWRVDISNPNKFITNHVNNGVGNELLQVLGNEPVTDLDLTASTNDVWGTKGAVIDLFNITTTNGVISFEAGKDLYPATVEDFENTPLAESGATALTGKFCTWDLTNAAIVETTENFGNGKHVACINKAGMLTSSALEKAIREITITVKNSATSAARVYFRTSSDGEKWTAQPTATSYYEISKSQSRTLSFRDIPKGTRFQIAVTTKNAKDATVACYVDDIAVTFKKETSGIEAVNSHAASQDGVQYNLAGQRVSEGYKGLVIKNGVKVMRP